MLLRPAFLLPVLFAALICGTPARAECAGRTLEGETIYRAPVCVPQTPARIVALDSTYNLTMALELGLPVVGAPLFDAGFLNGGAHKLAQGAVVDMDWMRRQSRVTFARVG